MVQEVLSEDPKGGLFETFLRPRGRTTGRLLELLGLPEFLPRGGLRRCLAALSLFIKIPVRIRWNSRWTILRTKLYPYLFYLVRITHLWRRYVNTKLLIFLIDRGALIVFEDVASLYHINN